MLTKSINSSGYLNAVNKLQIESLVLLKLDYEITLALILPIPNTFNEYLITIHYQTK